MYDQKIKKIFKYIAKLKQTMEFEEKLLVLANMARDVIEADRCSIWSYSESQGEFITKVAHGEDALHIQKIDGIIGHCFLTKKTIIYDDVYECEYFDPSVDKETGYRTKSLITLPILNNKNEAIGIFQALNKKTNKKIFTNEDENLLDLIVAYVAEALESTMLYEQLQERNQYIDKINKELEQKVKQRTYELNLQKQRAEYLTKVKSNFLANMSHEIRTPLNAIMGFIDILKETEQSSENDSYLDIVKNSSESLLGIINDILDFSKIENGNMTLEIIKFDLKQLIEDLGLLFYEKAKEKNIKITIKIDKNIPHLVNGDSLRLRQIITNLLGNAIKFTQENGNINITLEYDDILNNLTFKIEDSGIGISAKNLTNIFQPFLQEDDSTTRKFGGTGLGLSISYSLVKLMKSELKVKSVLGAGSLFYFTIPIISANTTDQIDKTQYIEEKDFDFSSKKILLVEDNKSNQMFMKVVLRKINLKFDIAADGIEAVKLFKINAKTEATLGCKYDAILMDENMPNMNGIEATKNILEYEKQNNLTHTPIIALTANALKGDRERFLEAGMDEYLTKPLNKKKLSEILGKFLV